MYLVEYCEQYESTRFHVLVPTEEHAKEIVAELETILSKKFGTFNVWYRKANTHTSIILNAALDEYSQEDWEKGK